MDELLELRAHIEQGRYAEALAFSFDQAKGAVGIRAVTDLALLPNVATRYSNKRG
jgi:hypothetical protein